MKKNLLLVFVFTINILTAQQGWWTWLHGNNTVVGGSGNFGTQGVAAPTNQPPQLYKTDACWTDNNGKFWFYGGSGSSGNYSALWKYDPLTNMWTWMKGPNTTGAPPVFGTKGVPTAANNPAPVGVGSALTWVDASNNLWLFGGALTSLGSSSDMWKYDQGTNMWTWMHGPGTANPPGVYGVQGVPSPANYPPCRYETSASWVDNAGNFWMFGGGVTTGQINDLWRYNPTTNEWTWMHGPNTAGNIAGNYGTKGVPAAANVPPCRWAYCRWTDNTGKFWLFGGTGVNNNTDSYNDIWRFDPAINQWTWISGSNTTNPMPAFPPKCVPSTTAYPQGRYENTLAWKDKCDNFWMYSGEWTASQGMANHSDVWCYKPLTNEWVYVNGNMVTSSGVKGVPVGSNWPGNTYGSAAFIFNNEFYMFGGSSSGPNADILWKYVPDSVCAKSFCGTPPVLPVAHFSADTLIGCAPLTVNFYNSSLNSTSWIWDFGDGSPTSTVQHPSHTYNNPGTYTVTLIASNGTISDTLVFTNYVIVYPGAVAGFTAPNDTICFGQSLTFTNTSTGALGYFWIVADPTWASISKGDTTTNFTYTFLAPGTYHVILNVDGPNVCDDADTMTVVVLTSVAITQNVSICSGNTYTLPGGAVVSAAGTYLDTLGSGPCDSIITTIITLSPASTFTQNPVICVGNSFTLPGGGSVSTAGTYTDTLTTTSGCDSIITTNLTTVNSFNSTQSSTICTGQSYTLPGGNSVTTAGTYLDTIPSVGGCDSIITTNLTVAPNVTGTQSATLCNGNTFTLPSGTIVSVAGTYVDTVLGSNGCDSIITSTITVNQNTSSSSSPVICSGNSYTLPSGTVVSVSGTYTDTVTGSNGCDSIITTILTVNPLPNITVSSNVIILVGDSTTLTASGGVTYSWTPSDGLSTTTGPSVVASPTVTTTYCVLVTDANGCVDTACVTITVDIICAKEENLGVPNAFSPNADGVNDDFCLQGWENCIETFNVKIYDRWGEKVFESIDPNFCWDGKYKGKIMDAQVYVYQIKAKFLNAPNVIIKKGNISLIR